MAGQANDGMWKLQNDGYINVNVKPNCILYHPNLNVLVVFSENSLSTVVDVNSGSILRRWFVSDEKCVQGTYLPGFDKVLLTDEKRIGVRSDYNGVLLLDSILQTDIKEKLDIVKVEMLICEAVLLQHTLKNCEFANIEYYSEVMKELEDKISMGHCVPKKGAKAQKWNIICLELPHSYLKNVVVTLVTELKRQNRHVPALAIASALNERLNLLHESGNAISFGESTPESERRNLMVSEAARRATFAKWPHMDYKWALPDQMAQAGFYHQPNATGDDRAMCFTCVVCLVCWEPTDEPWAEHERHSPSCPFVKGEYTQNVPLSVTHATSPGVLSNHPILSDICLVDISSLPGMIPICCQDRFVILIDYSNNFKMEYEIDLYIACDNFKMMFSKLKLTSAAIVNINPQINPINLDTSIKMIVDDNSGNNSWSSNDSTTKSTIVSPRPSLIVGAQIVIDPLENLEAIRESFDEILPFNEGVAQPYLIVLDFNHETLDKSQTISNKPTIYGSKKNNSGTGTTTATVGSKWQSVVKNVYQDHMAVLMDEMMDQEINLPSSSSAEYIVDSLIVPSAHQQNMPSTSTGASGEILKADLKKELFSLLENTDLKSASAKKLRKQLENKLNCDLSHRKKEIADIMLSYLKETAKKLTKLGTGAELDWSNKMSLYEYEFYNNDMDFFDHSMTPPEGIDYEKILENVVSKKAEIADVKHVPKVIQRCKVPTQNPDDYICSIHPLHDLLHFVVVLSDGSLHLYNLKHNGKVILIDKLVKSELFKDQDGIKKLILLPQDLDPNLAACITMGGHLCIIDLLELKVLSSFSSEKDHEFVAISYCNSLERICVATTEGCLKFFALREEDDTRSSDDASSSPATVKVQPSSSFIKTSSTPSTSDNLIVNRPSYGMEELKILYDLTLFENLSPCYTATVPTCWTELMQAQKQRRHAQHLTREDVYTRSWRLQNDLTTWDEHMFELSLPKNIIVGRVDVKLTLHTPCLQVPPLQVTLLRPVTSRAPFQSANYISKTPIDSGIEFPLPTDGSKANPITSDFYSNTEILCGPINISNCLDLSDQSCTISFSTPKLLKTKTRQLLVHIKALNFNYNKNNNNTNNNNSSTSTGGSSTTSQKSKTKDTSSNNGGGSGSSSSKNNAAAGASTSSKSSVLTNEYKTFLFGPGGSSNSKKSESFIGCDWIHEISITVRKNKTTNIPNEKLERSALIESKQVVDKLLKAVIDNNNPVIQSISLDILIWIAVIRLGRVRMYDGVSHQHRVIQVQFIHSVEEQLYDFIYTCFILGNRSIARKCAKFITVINDGIKITVDQTNTPFSKNLLKVLIDILPKICSSWSAGSVRWFFQILNKLMIIDTNGIAPQKCLDILNEIGLQLIKRQNPYHLILRTRFGLNGTPLESELFEYEPLLPTKFQSVPVSYVVPSDGGWALNHNTNWSPHTNANNTTSNTQSNINNPYCTTSTTSSTQNQSTSWMGFASESIDLRELLMPLSNDPTKNRIKGITINHYMKGLLEVEPLHFTCHSMSDGTKLEKVDPQTSVPIFSFYNSGGTTTAGGGGGGAGGGKTIVSENFPYGVIGEGLPCTSLSSSHHVTHVTSAKDVMCDLEHIFSSNMDNHIDKIIVDVHSDGNVVSYDTFGMNTDNYFSSFSSISSSKDKITNQENYINFTPITTVTTTCDEMMDTSTSSPLPPAPPQMIDEFWNNDNSFSCTYDDDDTTSMNKHLVDDEAPTPLPPTSHQQSISSAANHNEIIQVEETKVISWNQLLVPPPQQMMVIERMHSGARRFIVLDFGRPILLTDLLIPACSELLSLSIDIWTRNEDTDAIRLVVASDIASKNLILSDIQPPPICRYLKITTIGRYGMSTARCKIPVGSYYGHTLILPGEDYADLNKVNTCDTNIKNQLQLLSSLYEDIYCRYSLSCTKLKEYMTPLLLSETPNVVHMHRYFDKKKESSLFLPPPEQKDKIISCYKECMTYQHQLNIVKSVIKRLSPPVTSKKDPLVMSGCSDKLRLIGECLLDSLLFYVYEIGPVPKAPPALNKKFDEELCSRLFHAFCITEDTRLQVATMSLLVATCGPQSWWGSFLTKTFCHLYSSQQRLIFPQDRILMLFSWLGRKNLSICSGIVDSLMYALLTHLTPLAQRQNEVPSPGFLRANTDLSLITWLLMFLSQCLDCSSSDLSPETIKNYGTRWDFMCGELAMQKQKSKPKTSNCSSRTNRRRIQKKLMNQSIIYSNDLLDTKKSIVKELSEKISKPSSSSNINSSSTSGVGTNNNKNESLVTPLISLSRQHCLPCAKAILSFILHLDYTCNVDTFLIACKDLSRIIISTRPTLSLNELMTENELLHLVRLAVWSDQHRAVWGGPWTVHAVTCLLLDMLDGTKLGETTDDSSSSSSSGGIFGSTSTSGGCSTSSSSNMMDTSGVGTSASGNVVDNEEMVSSPSCSQSSTLSTISSLSTISYKDSPASPPYIPKIKMPLLGNVGGIPTGSVIHGALSSYVLPSVLESDDSDLEDFLDDILEKGRILVHKAPNAPKSAMGVITCSMSLAMDSRLEYGVENNAEVILKRLTAQSAYNLPISISTPLSSAIENNVITEWDESFTNPWLRNPNSVPPPASVGMLTNCFNTLFQELNTLDGWANIEQILELWLTLNGSGKSTDDSNRKFVPSFIPVIGMSPKSVSTLIQALTLRPNVSLRTWCLAFETLTLATNTIVSSSDPSNTDMSISSSLIGISRVIINEPAFIKMIYTFLSNSQLKTNQSAGPSVCSAFHNFLVRLQTRCDIISFTSELGNQFKEHLLTLLYMLVQNKGPLSCQTGPLDAQCEFIQHLLRLHFTSSHLPTAMSILESVGTLLYSYVTSLDTIKCLSITDTSINGPLSCFNKTWSSVISPPPTSTTTTSSSSSANQNTNNGDEILLKQPTYPSLITNLLKFCNKLIQIPLSNQNTTSSSSSSENQSTTSHNQSESQTDETKVEQGGLFNQQVTCLADVVLQHKITMEHLLCSLAGCTSSSYAIALAATNNLTFIDKKEPSSVGDSLYQILYTLMTKASTKKLALTPVLEYLSSWNNNVRGVFQLSEPFVWLLMKSINNIEAIQELLTLNGVTVICKGLIQSHSLVINPHPSQTSVLMQHLSQFPSFNLVDNFSTNKKVNLPPSDAWTYPPKLVNFAPLGTISTSNPASQAPDVLIQPSPPHRRARSPAWSYHFFTDEHSTELKITLPCAILLKEIQLQPHITALSTCPSAVALEVCHGIGTGMVPVGAPMETAGLTFIRLNLPQPEVVTAVLLRLYRAKDSNSLGLTQIRVIGSTSFGDTAFQLNNSDIPDEQKLTKSSIGWLRLLRHILSISQSDQNIVKHILEAASSQPLLLDTCASMLLLPAPPPALFSSALEQVLINIGLHSKELGLKLLNILLHNGAVTFIEGTLPLSKNSTASLDSVVYLIHLLCSTQDDYTLNRLSLLLSWLESVADARLQEGNQNPPPPPSSYVHCASVVLWSLNEKDESGGGSGEGDIGNVASSTTRDALNTLITDTLFDKIYQWSKKLKNESSLKKAVDNVLCSMCYIKKHLFLSLLQKMEILIPATSSTMSESFNISDDSKDCQGLTDDNKEMELRSSSNELCLADLRQLTISESQLMTIAAASQSDSVIQELIDSGLPCRLANAIYEFCVTSPQEYESDIDMKTDSDKATSSSSSSGSYQINGNTVGTILKFFTSLCSSITIKDWLGTQEGSIFWFPLLNYLNKKTSESSNFNNYSWEQNSIIPNLEALTIQFLTQCTRIHIMNQKLLARVLCDLISQQKIIQQQHDGSHMSGFTRRLVLRLLLENEKIMIYNDTPVSHIHGGESQNSSLPHSHPSYGVSNTHQIFYMSTDTYIGEILLFNIPLPSMLNLKKKYLADISKNENNGRDPALSEIQETLSATLTAGNTAKDKRLKDTKSIQKTRKKSYHTGDSDGVLFGSTIGSSLHVRHENIPWELPHGMTIGQVLHLHPPKKSYLKLSIKSDSVHNPIPIKDDLKAAEEERLSIINIPSIQSPLQIFSQMGGLALLAQHLPLVYPETLQFPIMDKPECSTSKILYSDDQPDADWVKIDYELYEEMEDINDTMIEVDKIKTKDTNSGSSSSYSSNVPPHSLAAFGLFLKLPGYADVLLKDKKKAQYLLRLVLGVTDDGEGGDIFKSSVSRYLPTLPFQVLQHLLASTPLTTDDGVMLRKIALDVGVLHLLLTCLANLTHLPTDLSTPLPGLQQQGNASTSNSNNGNTNNGSSTSKSTTVGPNGISYKSDDKSHLYWAKGTGFGTGSTTQNWNIEQALSRQRLEEEHVTALLKVLSSYISPDEQPPDTTKISSPTKTPLSLPPLLKHLLKQSCLLPALSTYLRNDSVLDMGRHIPLYRGVLQLIRAMTNNTELVQLLLPRSRNIPGPASSSDTVSIFQLLCNMKSCVDIYLSRLKSNDLKNKKMDFKTDIKTRKLLMEPDEDLMHLVEDIRNTVSIVQDIAKQEDCDMLDYSETDSIVNTPVLKTLEERYLEIMRALQFETYEMISENDGGTGFKFTVSYHYETNVRSNGERCHPARMKRLAQETVTLSTALPLSYSSSVFVRCDSDRLDIMKVLITGPSDTPYANGCFEFDVYFPPEYPNAPMLINLETTGHHSIRFNPNLYNDGKVCLSILNTWHGRPEEKWNAQTSSFLQVLVSIQSLILVSEPYFNEPGYERSRGTVQGTQSSREYNANIAQATVKWAMLEQIKNPTPCFKEVIHSHFWMKRKEIVQQIKKWINDMDLHTTDKRSGRSISLNTIALRRHFNSLIDELKKLKTPNGLEHFEQENSLDDFKWISTEPSTTTTTTTTSQQSDQQHQQQQSSSANSPSASSASFFMSAEDVAMFEKSLNS